jgi:hypothetical protein
MVYVDQVLNWSLYRRDSTVARTQQPPGPPFPASKYHECLDWQPGQFINIVGKDDVAGTGFAAFHTPPPPHCPFEILLTRIVT